MVYIPGLLLGASAQREDGASTAIYNPGCRQDSSARRQACPWREQQRAGEEPGRRLVQVGGGVKLTQGEKDLDRKQGERWGRWKDLNPPKDQRRSSRGWKRGPSCCWDTTARRTRARYPEEPVGSIVQ